MIRDIERDVPDLAIDTVVWEAAYDLARRCRDAGVSVPATDVLIAACAHHHGAAIEHDDADFERIARVVDGEEAKDEEWRGCETATERRGDSSHPRTVEPWNRRTDK